MPRLILALFLLIPICAVGLWFSAYEGSIRITWMHYRIDLSTSAAAIMLALLMLSVMLLSVFIGALMRWPSHYRLNNKLSRYEHGMEYITRGLSAYAMGDNTRALKELKKASRVLTHSPLPHLLAAQTGANLHDDARAKPHLMALLEHPATAYIGFKRLLEQAKNSNCTEHYHDLLQKAQGEFPYDGWLAERYIAHCLTQLRFDDAKAYLTRFSWRHSLPKNRRRTLLRLVALSQLRALHSTHAEDYTPYLADSACAEVAAASTALYATEEQIEPMLLCLLRSMRKSPSYGVASAVCVLMARATPETMLVIKKSVRTWHKHPHPDVQLLVSAIASNDPTHKAIAPPIWQCNVCLHVHTQWHPVCSTCDAVASIYHVRAAEEKTSAIVR